MNFKLVGVIVGAALCALTGRAQIIHTVVNLSVNITPDAGNRAGIYFSLGRNGAGGAAQATPIDDANFTFLPGGLIADFILTSHGAPSILNPGSSNRGAEILRTFFPTPHGDTNLVDRLALGGNISSSNDPLLWTTIETFNYFIGYDIYGEWPPGDTGYIGLRFGTNNISNSSYYYGWARVTVANDFFTLHEFAYNNTIGAPIFAGQMSAIPEPSTYAAICGGGGALLGAMVWRQRKGPRRIGVELGD